MEKDTESRFFRIDDKNSKTFVLDIADAWWSRKYEYEWAKQFCEKNDVVLDAASGVHHPFKYLLAKNCKEVIASDSDKNILSKKAIISKTKDILKTNIDEKFLEDFKNLSYVHSPLEKMPFDDKKFDKIFCISVLEHTPRTIVDIFDEFNRILKDDGMLVLTFDFPHIIPKQLEQIIDVKGFECVGDSNFEIPLHPLRQGALFCFRMLLKKKGEDK
ncbi:class I SAM-dependent methyltransferase [Oceanihabitans sediminis]|uniref:class I SAM-dependent methyltransferase n=1 Tax=Oceanihabitans sediminis TaxID=1812012 RepID=UPI00299D63BE|nr:class I SAM-dependent methyltransferase [Oceanihabitans sediminis]MDX1279324.1 class I SAM-dependent methyltransferase [Oceanihabitans sediminis]